MESDSSSEREDLSPAEALASTQAGREAIVRRITTPWSWDAAVAVGAGAFGCLIVAFPYPAGVFLAIPGALAAMWVERTRQRRVGVVADGSTSRTFDPVRVWAVGVAVAVCWAGLAASTRWEPAAFIGVVAAAAVMFAGLRWVNRRAVAGIRDAL